MARARGDDIEGDECEWSSAEGGGGGGGGREPMDEGNEVRNMITPSSCAG